MFNHLLLIRNKYFIMKMYKQFFINKMEFPTNPIISTIVDVKMSKNDDNKNYDHYDIIDIIFDNGSVIKITTEGDCCSGSWFEIIDSNKLLSNNNICDTDIIGSFDQLIGKTMDFNKENIVFTREEIDYTFSNYQNEDKNTKCKIILSDGVFCFLDRNASNGCYSSGFSVSYSTDELSIQKCKESLYIKDAKVTLVVGLPCSGKTTFCLNTYSDDTIYDDLFFCFSKREFCESLSLGKHVVINDPRLCDSDKCYYLYFFLGKILNRNQIKLICFKNEPDICKSNCSKLDNNKFEDIDRLSKKYSFCLKNWKDRISEMIDVYEIQ